MSNRTCAADPLNNVLQGHSVSESEAEELLDQTLENLALTQNERKMLKVLLLNGPRVSSFLSQQTGIQRTETYNYLNSLANQGYVFINTQARPTRYHALAIGEIIALHAAREKQKASALEYIVSDVSRVVDFLVAKKGLHDNDNDPIDTKFDYQPLLGYGFISAVLEKAKRNGHRLEGILRPHLWHRLYNTELTDSTTCVKEGTEDIPAEFILISAKGETSDNEKEIIIFLGGYKRDEHMRALYTREPELVKAYESIYQRQSQTSTGKM